MERNEAERLSVEDEDYLSFVSDWTDDNITFEQRLCNPLFYYEWALERLLELNPINSTVVDFGCADGVFTELLKPSDVSSVYGVDYSDKACSEYFENTGCPVEKDISFIHSPVDFVVALEVLEHTENPDEILEKLYDKVNTAVIFTVPIKEQVKDPHHKSEFDYDRVFDMCNKLSSKFQIYKISKFKRHGLKLSLFGVVLKKEKN